MSDLLQDIEAYSHQGFISFGKRNHYNEDRFFAGKNVFAVIDGATSLVSADMNGLNPSAYTAQFLSSFFARHDGGDFSAKALLIQAAQAFYQHLKADWPDILNLGKLGPCAAVSVAVLHNNTLSTATISDCSVVLSCEGEVSSASPHSQIHAELDKEIGQLVMKEMAKGITAKQARQIPSIAQGLKANRNRLNIDFCVFNHEVEAMMPFIHSYDFTLKASTQIALFSDGFLAPGVQDSAQAQIETMQQMQVLGVRGYYTHIKKCYDADPDFQTFPRLKHMDDTTGMLLTFDPSA